MNEYFGLTLLCHMVIPSQQGLADIYFSLSFSPSGAYGGVWLFFPPFGDRSLHFILDVRSTPNDDTFSHLKSMAYNYVFAL